MYEENDYRWLVDAGVYATTGVARKRVTSDVDKGFPSKKHCASTEDWWARVGEWRKAKIDRDNWHFPLNGGCQS